MAAQSSRTHLYLRTWSLCLELSSPIYSPNSLPHLLQVFTQRSSSHWGLPSPSYLKCQPHSPQFFYLYPPCFIFPPYYLSLFSILYTLIYLTYEVNLLHHNMNSMRARIFVCFVHCYTPEPRNTSNKYLLNEWTNPSLGHLNSQDKRPRDIDIRGSPRKHFSQITL